MWKHSHMRNPVLAWQGVMKHGLSQAYKFRNNETNKELRPSVNAALEALVNSQV